MLEKIVTGLLGVSLWLASGVSLAREYEVEIIVFERTTQSENSTEIIASDEIDAPDEIDIDEQWDFSSPRVAKQLQKMAILANQFAVTKPTEKLLELRKVRTFMDLSGTTQLLKVSDPRQVFEVKESRQVLDLIGTIQTVDLSDPTQVLDLGEVGQELDLSDVLHVVNLTDAKRSVHLRSARKKLLERGYRILDTARWQQSTSSFQDAPLISLGSAETALSAGFVQVYTTALIFANVDLQLSPILPSPADSEGIDEFSLTDTPAAQPHFFITEKRRIKFNQIHYFDHPYFGALLGIWPID